MVYPINRKGQVHSSPQSKEAGSSPAVAVTANKVGQIVKMPVTTQSREIRILNDAQELSKRIRRDWNVLEPSELAEQIVDLEGKVALLKETSPATDKIRKLAQILYFQFVFPVVLELSTARDPKMPMSFARMIYYVAQQVFEQQSFAPATCHLNARQISEVYKQAGMVEA